MFKMDHSSLIGTCSIKGVIQLFMEDGATI